MQGDCSTCQWRRWIYMHSLLMRCGGGSTSTHCECDGAPWLHCWGIGKERERIVLLGERGRKNDIIIIYIFCVDSISENKILAVKTRKKKSLVKLVFHNKISKLSWRTKIQKRYVKHQNLRWTYHLFIWSDGRNPKL